MKDLNDMLRHSSLREAQEEIDSQFSGLDIGYYDAKLAVMMSMLATEAMKKLEEVDNEDYPSKLKEQFETIKALYTRKVDVFRQHLEENARLIHIIDEADTDYPELERKITALLTEFDTLLKLKVDTRDRTPVGQL